MGKCPRCDGRGLWKLSTGQGRCRRCGLTRKFSQSRWTRTRILFAVKGSSSRHTKAGSLNYTDDRHVYASLRMRGNHMTITKDRGKPKGRGHPDGIEGCWSCAKDWLYRYLYRKEVAWRFNHRDQNLVVLLRK